MRCNTLRSLSGFDGPVAPPEASIGKLFWGAGTSGSASSPWTRPAWRRRCSRVPLRALARQRTFLFSRAETIYGGSNQIQRNIIGERVLGLPPDPKVEASASSSRVKWASRDAR